MGDPEMDSPITLSDLLTFSLNGTEFNSGHRNMLENFLRIFMSMLDIQPECIHIDTLNDIEMVKKTLDCIEGPYDVSLITKLRFFRSPDDYEERKSFLSTYSAAHETIIYNKMDYLECEINQLKKKVENFILEFRRRVPNRGDCDDRIGWPDEKCRDELYKKSPRAEINDPSPNITSKDLHCNKFVMQKTAADAATVLKNMTLCPTNELPKACKQTCNPVNNMACQLLTDKDFLSEIMKRIACPIIEKIFNFEEQMYNLNECFLKFIKTAEEELQKRPTAEDCMEEIENLKRLFEKRDDEFLHTMEEVQEILDSKFDKYHVPPLKKYVTDTISVLDKKVKLLQEEKDCPKGAGTLLKNLKCLSCQTTVCQFAGAELLPKPPQFTPSKAEKTPITEKCATSTVKRHCGGEHTIRKPNERVLRNMNLVDEFGNGVVYMPKLRYLQGIDGSIYRAETQQPKCVCDVELNKRGRDHCKAFRLDEGILKGTQCPEFEKKKENFKENNLKGKNVSLESTEKVLNEI